MVQGSSAPTSVFKHGCTSACVRPAQLFSAVVPGVSLACSYQCNEIASSARRFLRVLRLCAEVASKYVGRECDGAHRHNTFAMTMSTRPRRTSTSVCFAVPAWMVGWASWKQALPESRRHVNPRKAGATVPNRFTSAKKRQDWR